MSVKETDGGYTIEFNKPPKSTLSSTVPTNSNDPANLAAQGQVALSSQDYPKAIDLFTRALNGSPTSVDYYIKRSTANQRAGRLPDALNDAEIAVNLAHKRGKRELIGTAQMRRAISLTMLERFGDAGECFKWALAKNPGDKSAPLWQKKLENELAKCDEEDIRREVTVKEIPEVTLPKPVPVTAPKKENKEDDEHVKKMQTEVIGDKIEEIKDDEGDDDKPKDKGKGRADGRPSGGSNAAAAAAPAPPPAPPVPQGVTTPASKIRHEWYQTNTNVVVSLFVKGVPKDQATVEINDESVSITFPLPSGSDFTFDLDPLCHKVDPSKSTYRILGTKVEVTLIKYEAGRKWATLESTATPAPAADNDGSEPTKTTTAPAPEPAARPPAYPTSSKSGPKNWDKVVNDLAAKSKSKKKRDKDGNEIPDEKGDDDEIDYADIDDDDFGNDPVNSFFKKLYKGADDDTRRAMMKSYQESNGTALSTNWSEVGKGPVETSPPEGMVAKKWGE